MHDPAPSLSEQRTRARVWFETLRDQIADELEAMEG